MNMDKIIDEHERIVRLTIFLWKMVFLISTLLLLGIVSPSGDLSIPERLSFAIMCIISIAIGLRLLNSDYA